MVYDRSDEMIYWSTQTKIREHQNIIYHDLYGINDWNKNKSLGLFGPIHQSPLW